ncbi:helix-loop-helix protein 1-like [Hirundo rustica]|uniref:helix-loop-helix protein 1-like n=1 Tax=Hirundo rustica TaxID=43150 RepID=UPI002671A15B|nr:helix-loop-helix protein 1-like [Hirundo rustica]
MGKIPAAPQNLPPSIAAGKAPEFPGGSAGSFPAHSRLIPGWNRARSRSLSCGRAGNDPKKSPGGGGGGGGGGRGGGRPALPREPLSREERRRRRRATAKYRRAHATRERIRVEAFNAAFGELRRLLPTLPPDKRLAKIEILRLAICYISYLNHVLDV